MANLIITIISIGLVAVAAMMAIYYGGQAYQATQINAIANSIMAESQQILSAARLYTTDKYLPDATGTTMTTWLNAKYLSSWPSGAIGQLGGTPHTVTWGDQTTIDTKWQLPGQSSITLTRQTFAYQNGNYVLWAFNSNGCGPAPLWAIGAAINLPYGKPTFAWDTYGVPTGCSAPTVYTSTGIPHASPASTTTLPNSAFSSGNTPFQLELDSNGNLITNYCYKITNGAGMSCVFGPS